MRKWILAVVVGLVALVTIVTLVGLALPIGHRAQRTTVVSRPPADVFAAIADFTRYPDWRPDVRRVSVEGAGVGALVREESGGDTLTYRVEVYDPPSRLVTRIADESLSFGGSWTYELRAMSAGTELTITENGEVYNPIFRVLSRFVFGHHAAIDGYLSDLAAKRWTQ
jgi:hypothetical protein